jgi:SnoaL-like protein
MTETKRKQGSRKTSASDRRNIRELIENWAIWRDARLWDHFRTVWHKDGQIWATWFQGTYEDFIRMNDEGWKRGVRIVHSLGGTAVDINGARAIAQTRMTISQRAPVDGVLCDVVCTGRFYDFLEKRSRRWGIVLRRGIYEKDRIDPVNGAARPDLDQKLLARFPEGYRHLAYLQTRIGYKVRDDVPGPEGAELDALYALGASWLSGGKLLLTKPAA